MAEKLASLRKKGGGTGEDIASLFPTRANSFCIEFFYDSAFFPAFTSSEGVMEQGTVSAPTTFVTELAYGILKDGAYTLSQYFNNAGAWQLVGYPIRVYVNGTQVSEGTSPTQALSLSKGDTLVVQGHTGGNAYLRKYVLTES